MRREKASRALPKSLCVKIKMNIEAPHIPLGISLEEGLGILKGSSSDIEKHDDGNELFYKVDTGSIEHMGIEKL